MVPAGVQYVIKHFKLYPTMKASGVEWLGEVPAHWEVRRLKQLCRLAYGDALPTEIRQDGTVPVFGSNGRVGFHSSANTKAPCIIVGRKGSFGKVNYSRDSVYAIDTTFFIDSRFSGAHIRWLFFLLGWLRLDEVTKDSAVPGLDREDAYQRLAPVPLLPEQAAIVRFLDHADRRIRRYIRAKQKLIALLEEQKQAIIHQGVTGQIDVRTGQPYPAYKPSGVEWLGKVPEHWERRAVWQLFQIGRGKVTSHEYIANHPGPFPLYSSQTNNDGVMGYIDTYMFEGDFLTWTTDGAHAGTVFRRSGKFNCTNVCGTLYPKTRLDLDFMRMAIASETKRQVRLDINPKLMNNMMARIRVSVPPCDEQVAIAKYVHGIAKPSDLVIERAKLQIDFLNEYRTRLIADVVTGKLDVREVAATLPEVDPLAAEDTPDDTINTDAV